MEDLVGKLAIRESEVFIESSNDPEETYADAFAGNVEEGGIDVTLYDNVMQGDSPAGRETCATVVPVSQSNRAPLTDELPTSNPSDSIGALASFAVVPSNGLLMPQVNPS